jgi:hypothetical protein
MAREGLNVVTSRQDVGSRITAHRRSRLRFVSAALPRHLGRRHFRSRAAIEVPREMISDWACHVNQITFGLQRWRYHSLC